MTATPGDVVPRLLALLTGDDPHRRACRAELGRAGTTVVAATMTAEAAGPTMRARLAAAGSGALPPPDLAALSGATGRLDYVMVFGRDHDCQVLLTPAGDAGPGDVVFCWASPTTRQHLPVTT